MPFFVFLQMFKTTFELLKSAISYKINTHCYVKTRQAMLAGF